MADEMTDAEIVAAWKAGELVVKHAERGCRRCVVQPTINREDGMIVNGPAATYPARTSDKREGADAN